MTRQRRFGQDEPFSQWIREQRSLDSVTHKLTVNDVDHTIHKYATYVWTKGARKECRRSLQLMMEVEVKTRSALPDRNQLQTLFNKHQLFVRDWHDSRYDQIECLDSITGKQSTVRHYGVSVLSMSGTRPDDSDTIKWLRFNKSGRLMGPVINTDTLIGLLGFDLDPVKVATKIDLRDHHVDHGILVEMVDDLPLFSGIPQPRKVRRRS